MSEAIDWKKLKDESRRASVLAQRYNLGIWDQTTEDSPSGRIVEAFRVTGDGEKISVLVTESWEEMIEKLAEMGQRGDLEQTTVTNIDPTLWRLHVDSAAFSILDQLQDMRETFHKLIGPLGLVHDRYCVVDSQIHTMMLQARNLTNAIRRVKVKEEVPDG